MNEVMFSAYKAQRIAGYNDGQSGTNTADKNALMAFIDAAWTKLDLNDAASHPPISGKYYLTAEPGVGPKAKTNIGGPLLWKPDRDGVNAIYWKNVIAFADPDDLAPSFVSNRPKGDQG